MKKFADNHGMRVKRKKASHKPKPVYKHPGQSTFAKGNPGRPAGSKNKYSFSSLKQAFIDAFNDERVGGTEGLILWIIEDPFHKRHFYQWITKMLPRTVDVQGVDPVTPTNLNGLKEEELDAVLIGVGRAIEQKKVTNG